MKALGIAWKSKTDCFNFKVGVEQNAHPTKRSVLSIITRLFDPLGLLGPVITRAKSSCSNCGYFKLIKLKGFPRKKLVRKKNL
ncbi:uncharacterized protein TNCV_2336411 [Trichonephila clavipes]|uniref:Uncharacterized protein n=1 Tax=Trichonephila clavipes TaxID=2585209 RepID=A0A8X6SQH7_TRICX|nr:uncharacterized protein TNCV_2336411 [Trichonephila clavipes]